MDRAIIKRLMLCRSTLTMSRRHLTQDSDFGAWQAVTSLHDAVETFLLTIADGVGVPRAWRALHEYPKAIEQQSGKKFRHTAFIHEVNDLRVPAKHKGLFPHQSSVAEITKFRRHGLPEQAKHMMDVPDLVRSGTKRKLPSGPGWTEVREMITELENGWQQIKEKLRLLFLGVSLADYATFSHITPIVHRLDDGRRHSVIWTGKEGLYCNRENAEFCLNFVLTTIERLQASVRVRDSMSHFKIRANRETTYRAIETGVGGVVAENAEIEEAEYCLATGGYSWAWVRNGERVTSPFDDFDIVSEERIDNFGRR